MLLKAMIALATAMTTGVSPLYLQEALADSSDLCTPLYRSTPLDRSTSQILLAAATSEKSDVTEGPVTDDQKLITPVAKDKNPSPGSPWGSHSSDRGNKNKSAGVSQSSVAEDSPLPLKTKPLTPGLKPSQSQDETGASATSSHESAKNTDVFLNDKGPISRGAVKVAQDLEILNQIADLSQMKRDGVYVPGQKVHTLEVLSKRQDLSENLFAAVMANRRVIAELDREISGYTAVAHVLEEMRDQSIRNNNILNFTTGGALTSTQGGLSIGTKTPFQNTGNILASVAGGLTILISGYAIKLQRGASRSADRDPNMLAPVFGLVPPSPNKYPAPVWKYLNDYEPGQKKTRREQLIERWITLHYIEPLDKKTSHHHLEQLAGTIDLRKEVNIDMLRDRIPMLEDLRSAVAGIDEYLDEILTFVRQP